MYVRNTKSPHSTACDRYKPDYVATSVPRDYDVEHHEHHFERHMSTKLINPAHLYDGAAIGMSQAKVDLASGLIFVSGQVDWDRDSQVRHATLEEQAEGAIQHLMAVLSEAGASLKNVLQLRVYVRGELADSMAQLAPVFARHFREVRPALTGVGVLSLASRETLIEIEALAKLPDHA